MVLLVHNNILSLLLQAGNLNGFLKAKNQPKGLPGQTFLCEPFLLKCGIVISLYMGFTKIQHNIDLPNTELQKDLEEAQSDVCVKTYKNKKALFDSLKKL